MEKRRLTTSRSNLLFYDLSERGNPKGSVACCRSCLALSDKSLYRKGFNPKKSDYARIKISV